MLILGVEQDNLLAAADLSFVGVQLVAKFLHHSDAISFAQKLPIPQCENAFAA
jgi:hypothetical protein